MIHHGDLFDVLPTLEADSIDACVTDPPYGLEFMGKDWDKLGATAEGFRESLDESGRVDYHGKGNAPFGGGGNRVRYGRSAKSMQDWHERWAREVYRVLKPGAHMLVMGAPRTAHRMIAGVEDAGFEIRDCLCWLFGQGFPKSLDIGKAIDKVKDRTLLGQLNEEIRRARAVAGFSLSEIGERMLHATGGQYGKWYHRGGHMFFETGMSLPSRPEWELLRTVLPINERFCEVYESAEREVIAERKAKDRRADGTVIGLGHSGNADLTAPATEAAKQWDGWGTALKPAFEMIVLARKPFKGSVAQNVLTHGTGGINVDACRIGYQSDGDKSSAFPGGRVTNLGSGKLAGPSGAYADAVRVERHAQQSPLGRWPANVLLDEQAAAMLDEMSGDVGGGFGVRGSGPLDGRTSYAMPGQGQVVGFGDSGGASRFFYLAKPSQAERNLGCYGLPYGQPPASARSNAAPGRQLPLGRPRENHHPTVKPIELMRWLIRLITPPGGTVLDPFCGSGTTGCAAAFELRPFIGIEREAEYVAIAERRIRDCAPLFQDAGT